MDLEEIWRFSVEEWSVAQADAYTGSIQAMFHRLAEQPGNGAAFTHARHGYRRFLIESHAIFYRVTPSELEIVRILHQRRNAAHILR